MVIWGFNGIRDLIVGIKATIPIISVVKMARRSANPGGWKKIAKLIALNNHKGKKCVVNAVIGFLCKGIWKWA